MSGEGVIPPRGDRDRLVTKRLRRGTMICPYCRSDIGIRSHNRQTDTVSTLETLCLNTHCGATFRHQISLVYVVSPSAIAGDLDLPQAPPEFVRKKFPGDQASRGPPGEGERDQFDLLQERSDPGGEDEEEAAAA